MSIHERAEHRHCVRFRHRVRVRRHDELARGRGHATVDVGCEAPGCLVLDHPRARGHRANASLDVRDDDDLVDLRRERREQALELDGVTVGDDDRRDRHRPSTER